jgi:hypothetical protein
VTTNQVLLGVGLILALAVGSQVLASRLRVPALIILLPAGFAAGARICTRPADGGAPPGSDVLDSAANPVFAALANSAWTRPA